MDLITLLYQNNTNENIKREVIIDDYKITLFEFKQIINEKFNFVENIQNLTLKLKKENSLINLQDDKTLLDYNIKNSSEIIIENTNIKSSINQTDINKNKNESILQENTNSKIPNPIKSSNFSSSTLSNSIKSNIEKNKEIDISYMNLDDVKKLILHAIKNNQIKIFTEIINKYNYLKNNYNYLTTIDNNYTALHYSSLYGCVEITNKILDLYKNSIDINEKTKEGYSALHLAVFKNKIEIVKILIKIKGIKIDEKVPKFGNVLHIACKLNNLKIVNLLISTNIDPFDKNDEDKIPIDLTNDEKIKKVLKNYMNKKSNKNILVEKNNFVPPKPNKTIGFIEKIGQWLPTYKIRLIEIDPTLGYIKRYKTKDDYPFYPK